MDKKVIEYKHKDVTVVWQPHLCIHAAKCVAGAPEVFRPKEKPWVDINKASAEKITHVVNHCPSGALSIKKENSTSINKTEISVTENGPFLVKGSFQITDKSGSEISSPGTAVALCRCGASNNKPFCDGAHKRNGFIG